MSSSPCLSGNTYVLDLELVKSTSRTSQISSSSPSSTISESSNSPFAILSTRKARTPRKRPNQTYNEAAALLSTAYPNIFSTKHVKNSNFCTTTGPLLLDESSELLLPFRVFDNSGFLLHQPVRESPGAGFFCEPRAMVMSPSCQSSSSTTTTATWEVDSMEVCEGYREDDPDFDAESMLDEEVGEGIDSIMGNLCVGNEVVDGSTRGNSGNNCYIAGGGRGFDPWYAHPIGLSLGGRSQSGGLRIGGVRALRRVHDENCQNFPIVDMLQISPRLGVNRNSNSNLTSSSKSNSNLESKPNLNSGSNPNSSTKLKLKLTLPNPKPKSNSEENNKKKKKKKVERPISELMNVESAKEDSMEESPIPELVNYGLKLKLNYDEVLDAWSDRGMPLPEEIAGTEGTEGTDVSARLAQIDLFSENGGLREASVLRYKEKRRNRLFSNSKKIRYQVRKVNADRRPRMKGRFVRRPNGSLSHQKREE